MANKKQDAALKYTRVSPVTNVVFSFIFIVLALLCFLPALLVCIVSFSSEASVLHKGYSFFPDAWSVDSYAYLARQADYVGRAFLNSIGITVVGTSLGLVLCSTMGYALSRPNYRLRGFFTWFVFIPMLFSGGLVASYMINAQVLGLKNTYWVLILPICCSSFYIIIMRTFFSNSIPYELQEAAQIDGCTPFGILVRIILPLSIPVMCVIGLYYGVFLWNSYFQSLIYLTDKDKWPLQLFLRQILVANDVSAVDGGASPDEMARRAMRAETIKYAIVVLASVPMLIIYPFVQRYFVKGVMIGSVKG